MQKTEVVPKSVPNVTSWHASKVLRYLPMHVSSWMVENRKHYPQMLFYAGAFALGIVIGTLALSFVSQVAAQAAYGLLAQLASGIVFVSVAAILLTMTFGAFKAVQESEPLFKSKAIAETAWQAPDISPDILACLLPGETLPTFAQRAGHIRQSKDICPERWAAIIFPNSDQAMILTDGDPYIFTRGNEPFLDKPEDWAGKVNHASETPEVYRRYVDWFCDRYTRWVTAEKISLNQKATFKILTANMAAKAEQNQ